jgi:hypothetical protein
MRDAACPSPHDSAKRTTGVSFWCAAQERIRLPGHCDDGQCRAQYDEHWNEVVAQMCAPLGHVHGIVLMGHVAGGLITRIALADTPS